jgi:hypothetical protein
MLKNYNFAINDTTTYTGKDSVEKFYSAALLSAPTIQNVTLVPNVKSKIKLAKFDLGNIIQDEDCTFSGSGEGTLAQKAFEVCPLKINLEYCRSTFEQNFMNEFMRPGFSEEVMPSVFQDYILSLVAKQVSADLEVTYWRGDVVTTGSTYPVNVCEGIEYKLSGDTDVVDLSATTLTSANIISELQRVYDAIPDEIINKEDFQIFLSTKGVKLFRQAVGNASNEAYFNKGIDLNFLGYKIVEAPGLSANTIVAGQKSNFVWLLDLVSDQEDVLVIPQRNISGAPTVRIVGNFKFGTGYLYGAEIVYKP